jgi:hypothetical protein
MQGGSQIDVRVVADLLSAHASFGTSHWLLEAALLPGYRTAAEKQKVPMFRDSLVFKKDSPMNGL